MGRPIRIYYPGLIYHILNRGNNRQMVFAEDSDYRHYLGILQRYKEKFGFKIFAYCLMANHIHLLIQVSQKASISKIMQAITIAHNALPSSQIPMLRSYLARQIQKPCHQRR